MIAAALAVVLAQAASTAEPLDNISDHVRFNIRYQVRSGTAAAIVSVTSADAKTAKLHVDEALQGALPADLEVPARPFYLPDLKPGTQLLVFFHGHPGAWAATGQYELVIDGKIREYDSQSYLARTRWEIAKAPKPVSAPAAPAHASLSTVAAKSTTAAF
jgi:hypothetical protein